MKEKNKMILIALSGGVDSMVLSYLYKKENVVLAFVNYNFRKDTYIDQKIVTDFAKENNLKLEILTLDGKKPEKNFQNWARNIRYNFFKQVYDKYKCNMLLIAHHKDDFLETCLMQENKNKDKLFFGIKEKTTFMEMNIYRPLLFKFWKNEIYSFAKKHNIQYNDDWTNFESNYQRNYIRNNVITNMTIEQKNNLLKKFYDYNEKNINLINEIKQEYINWKQRNFDKKFFVDIKNKEQVIIKYINENYKEVKLNKNIIQNIILFINSKENNKKFKLSKNQTIYKKNNRLFVCIN